MMTRRWLVTTVAVLWGVGVSGGVVGAQTFPDITDNLTTAAVEWLVGQEVIEGYTDGTYRPDQPLTRAEMVKILTYAQGVTTPQCRQRPDWVDVPTSAWFADVLCAAAARGWVTGDDDTPTFRPNAPVNLAEAATLLGRITLGEGGPSLSPLPGEAWFAPAIARLASTSSLPPSNDTPDQPLTRGQMAQMVWSVRTRTPLATVGQPLVLADSCEALIDEMQAAARWAASGHGPATLGQPELMLEMAEMANMVDMAAPMAMMTTTAGGLARTTTQSSPSNDSMVRESVNEKSYARAGDASQTNLQEAGVDEPDIIKNDASHIVTIKGETVRIVSAIDPANLRQVAKWTVGMDNNEQFWPRELLLDGQTLTVIGEVTPDYDRGDIWLPVEPLLPVGGITPRVGGLSVLPPRPDTPQTLVVTYDLTDRAAPREVRRDRVAGRLTQARRIDDKVYILTEQYLSHGHHGGGVPLTDTPIADLRDLPALGRVALAQAQAGQGPSPAVLEQLERLTGPQCGNVHLHPRWHQQPHLLTVSVIHPGVDRLVTADQTHLLGVSGQMVYMSEQNLYTYNTGYDWVTGSERTDITRLALRGTTVAPAGNVTVPGRVDDRYQLSEYANELRVATTDRRGNHIYVIESDFATIRSLEGLAPGEHIKAARYLGDKGYLVTFRTTDPLYSIDLTPGVGPRLLGELKIPGWSDYLHPWDDRTLIGIGKEVRPEAEAADVLRPEDILGVKVSIFDVSDTRNPRETHKLVIGGPGSESAALHDPHALVWHAADGLLALPVSLMPPSTTDTPQWDRTPVWLGAIVLELNKTDGITLRGRMTHHDQDIYDQPPEEFWRGIDHEETIKRLLWVNDEWYSLSDNVVTSHRWADLSTLDRLELDPKNCADLLTESSCRANPYCRPIVTDICTEVGGIPLCTGQAFDQCVRADRAEW